MSKFQVGDMIRGTSPQNEPYGITCIGWTGKVIKVDTEPYDMIFVNYRARAGSLGGWVESKYFELVETDGKKPRSRKKKAKIIKYSF